MRNLADIKSILIKHKQRLSEKYGLSKLAVFGSYSSGRQRENSDVDIMVEFKKPVGIEFIDLANELEQLLNIKVDLVSKNGIREQYLLEIEQELSYV